MWVEGNRLLAKRLPRVHKMLKRTVRPFLNLRMFPPVPKFLRGRFVLMHPTYIASPVCEPKVQAWLEANLAKRAVFFDVGAYHGVHTMLGSRLTGRGGWVVAFEPSPPNLERLRYHLRMNLMRNVEVVACIVGQTTETEADFWMVDEGVSSSNSAAFGSLETIPRMEGSSLVKVKLPSVSLDDFHRRSGLTPDVIKIDVEGFEVQVIRGASHLLREHRPLLILAVHPFWLPPGDTPNSLMHLLEVHGYEAYDDNGLLVETLDFDEYLLVPRERCSETLVTGGTAG